MGRCQWGGRISGTKGGGSDGDVIGCRGRDRMGGWEDGMCWYAE